MDKVFSAEFKRLFAFLAFLLGGISQAMLFLAVYCPQFFQRTATTKLLILSMAIPTPLFALEMLLPFVKKPRPNLSNINQFEGYSLASLTTGGLMCIIPFYGSILFRVLFHVGGLRTGIIVAGILAVVQYGVCEYRRWPPHPDHSDLTS